MAGRFEVKTVVNRPIEEVFTFLADSENDPKFSPRVLEIEKTTEGPPGVGTVYASTVKDAGMTTKRELKLTEFDPPTRIRWTETSKNLVTSAEGGYDLAPSGEGTEVTLFNVLEGHGLGVLLTPLAVRGARSQADDFGRRIKEAVEVETAPPAAPPPGATA
jgi:carbon monoxide dehydrogenase subunit G